MEYSITQPPRVKGHNRGLGPVKGNHFFKIISKTLFLATIAISKINATIGIPAGQFWIKQQAYEEKNDSGSEMTKVSKVAYPYPKADIS